MIILQSTSGRLDGVAFSPDGRTLAALSANLVRLWADFRAGARPSAIIWSRADSAAFTADGRRLLLARDIPSTGGLYSFDLATEAFTRLTLELEAQTSFDLSPDGRAVLCTQIDWRGPGPYSRGLLSLRRLDSPTVPEWSITAERAIYQPPIFLPGGQRFVVIESYHSGPPQYVNASFLVIRDAADGGLLSETPHPAEGFGRWVPSPDRRLIAGRSSGHRIAVLRTDDFTAPAVVVRNDNRKDFTGLAFHPSGRFLAATSNDKTVKLYDTSTWALAHAFDWQIGRLRSVAFSADGMLAAAGGDKGQIVVWDFDL